jgi:preprotein translocase subunit Sss1
MVNKIAFIGGVLVGAVGVASYLVYKTSAASQ